MAEVCFLDRKLKLDCATDGMFEVFIDIDEKLFYVFIVLPSSPCNSFLYFFFIALEIVDEIKKCNGLETLRLQGNTLGVEAAKVISDALKDKPTFKVGIIHFNILLILIHIFFFDTEKIFDG